MIVGFILYKLAQKKKVILELLGFISLGAFILAPVISIILVCLYTLDEVWIILSLPLGFGWFFGSLFILLWRNEIISALKGFAAEYRQWKKDQTNQRN